MSAKAGASERASFYRRFVQWAAGLEDGAILRVAFFALLAGTISVLYLDYRELMAGEGESLPMPGQPILPPALDSPAQGPMPDITTSPELLAEPLRIELGTGGRLLLTGTIDPGAAERFAAEIEARGEYVKTVVLDSPGGSVGDALTMGGLIREKGLGTEVGAGALCASSCPLVFAAGAERIAAREAAIGVHQIYAAALSDDPQSALRVAGFAMSDAQTTTGKILTYLTDMGVDPALWVHALETPPQQLYYFSPQEMESLKLVTEFLQD